ncbi:MAG: U32 family peptidase [Fibrobacterota bacterium]
MKLELVSPAGSFETLRAALDSGADAVYFGPRQWSLRAGVDDFAGDGFFRAIDVVHAAGRRAYVTLNAVIGEESLDAALRDIAALKQNPPDAAVISDPGFLDALAEAGIPAHLSTQANVQNHAAARFWQEHGVRRIVLARELSIPAIGSICANASLEFEAFVHGAMCISYSGRCLLSDYLAGRGGNKGNCANTCRWPYALVEKRGGKTFPIAEENGETYILNSKDLCALSVLQELVQAGVTAFKIEGRNKGLHYVAVVTRVYRDALDAILSEGPAFRVRDEWTQALSTVSHREYTTGFYRDLKYGEGRQNYSAQAYSREWTLVGVIRETLSDTRGVVDIRNDFEINSLVSLFSPERGIYLDGTRVLRMESIQGTAETGVHTNRVVIMEFEGKVSAGSLVRNKLTPTPYAVVATANYNSRHIL